MNEEKVKEIRKEYEESAKLDEKRRKEQFPGYKSPTVDSVIQDATREVLSRMSSLRYWLGR